MDRHRKALAALPALLAALLLSACAGLPSLEQRSSTHSLSKAEAAETALGQLIEPLTDVHPGKSGVHLLVSPHDAFEARTRLAEAAERTLDIQSYIWRMDETGMMLFDALRKAADRGVRVRLMLDDYNTSGMDALLAEINAHENIEVRLFNPFTVRTPRWWQLLTDLPRINRRMHNKTFTVDNSVTILGGRNVADEYFGATDTLFTDVDVLALGPVVNQVSQSFDRYWHSESSYPAELILEPAQDGPPPGRREAGSDSYQKRLGDRDPVDAIRDRDIALCWASTELVVDPPTKGLGEANDDELILAQLRQAVGVPQSRLTMISSYFIPTEEGADAMVELARRGVRVRVLTNSMAATDEALVHSAYAKWRDDLLQGGVRLYEMERGGDGASERNITTGPYGSASSTLHAKTYAVDDQLVVGSFNADPRSVHLNTEIGLVIECPELAEKVHRAFPERVMKHSYKVRLDDNGNLYWLEKSDDGVIRHGREPDTGFWQRILLPVYSRLPIDGLL
jgi:putative cardiolipin synthase